MDENIQRTINKLYALRAGLSLASSEIEKIEQIEDKTKLNEQEKVKKIEEKNIEILNEKSKSESNKNYFRARISELEEEKNFKEKFIRQINDSEGVSGSTIGNIKKFLIVMIVSVALICILTPACALDEQMVEDDLIFMPAFCFGLSFMVGLIGFLVNKGIASKEKKRGAKERKELIEEVIKIDEEIEWRTKTDHEQIYLDIVEEKQKDIEEIENDIEKINEEKCVAIAPYAQKGREIYEALIPVFNELLDERDWKNVDLIIYLFETRRAKDMQEALQQVDQYRHTERIAVAISEASNAISLTISRGMRNLKGAINEFAVKVNKNLEEIKANQNRIASCISESNTSMVKVIEEVALQKALLEKSCVSSNKMVEDIEKMRGYTEEWYRLNRNEW